MGHSKISTSSADFFYYFFRNSAFTLVLILLLSAIVLSPSHTSADNSSLDNVVVSIPSSCTLSATVNVEHSLSTLGGTYADDIGSTTLKTLCNDANGFAIYAIGSSRSNEGNTVLASSLGEKYDIITGTATSGNTSNWAMKLTTNPEATYPITLEPNFATGSYVSVPGTWIKVASRTSGTDTATEAEVATGASLNTTYSVYVTPAQPAGTYVGQVKYVLLHPNTNSNIMTLQMAFDEYVGPEHKIPLENSADPNTPTYYRMQDMTNQICQAATSIGSGGQMQLIDDRINLDGKKRLYWVAKLADGNCWMTQNLDLDLIADHTYTHSDTDLGWDPNNFDTNATWTFADSPSTIPWDAVSGSFPGWQDSITLPYSADPGEKYYYTSNSTSNDIAYNSLLDCTNAGHTDCEHHSAGNYYNWTAATTGDSANSVCPAGWRLTSSNSDDYNNLLMYYKIIANNTSTNYEAGGFNNLRKAPLYFVRSGYVDSHIQKVLDEGRYQLREKYSSRGVYYYSFNSGSTGIKTGNNNNGAWVGSSIRCLAR